MRINILWFFLILAVSCRPSLISTPSPVGPTPSTKQLEWHELETYAFIHFTTNTFTGKEWGYGDESPSIFNPTNTNVDQWVRTLKNTGFKAVILTAKHHDGFCLWPSKYTKHSIAASPYKKGKGDLVKEVAQACKKHGLKFGLYLSPWDRNREDYGSPSYVTYYRNQLKELFENYGPVFEMWFDGANGGDGYYGGAKEKRRIDGKTYYDWPGTISMVRNMEPNILFFSDAGPDIRWVGNERGIAGETNWNTISPDTLYAGKAGIESLLNTGHENGTSWIPAEVDVSIRPGWFYHAEEDGKVKTPEELFDIYLTSVGRGSNLLLNIPPDRRGLLHEKDVEHLEGFHALLKERLGHNYLRKARVKADKSLDKTQRPLYLVDGKKDTFWAAEDKQAEIEISLNKPQELKYITLQEHIALGQRVKSFEVEVNDGNRWVTVGRGTTIGYKRILKIQPITAKKIRIRILDAKGPAVLNEISAS
ncbi:coagulation factor 5/8 type domain protein [Leadbetterella byssophila DSM 17132]|uniref:alpha-L-fucosidase n=1 Tax=Leadbetterella byssophila (strain DSM 17132 / JCM 16389 / KACC 11308 / NBRC 106382 / 4M15) TaxID=649349 RepID=E4RYB6_LEAB4|nr:alpha-L-fucosidase [Leadbetterella byssophila]ADQ18152.1 coagulation factor 5/8 type domain protein [Leadbetterella byssophila DSM 17132]